MNFIIEFLIELLFEGVFDAGTNKLVPKWIRYPLFVIIVLFYISLIILFLIVAIKTFKIKIINGLIILLIDIGFTALTIYTFIKKIKEWKNK